jgi:potassium intermediate/small conductance calcium-activated channel subfamily N
MYIYVEDEPSISFTTNIMCFLGLLDIIFMFIENEIIFKQIDHQDTILNWCIKLIITITIIILIGLIFFYHRLDLILCSVNNSTNDWRVGLTNKKFFLIIIEVIACVLYFIISYDHFLLIQRFKPKS